MSYLTEALQSGNAPQGLTLDIRYNSIIIYNNEESLEKIAKVIAYQNHFYNKRIRCIGYEYHITRAKEELLRQCRMLGLMIHRLDGINTPQGKDQLLSHSIFSRIMFFAYHGVHTQLDEHKACDRRGDLLL